MKHRIFLMAWLLPSLALAMGTPPRKPATTTPGASGVMLRDDALRATPSATAASVASLAKGAKVRVLAGDGGWTQVYAAGKTGWVRILSVKSEIATTPDLGALAEVGGRAHDPGKVVAVAGARGLDDAALKAAQFNPDELARLEVFVVNRADAEQFAQMAGLTRRDMPYLPGPDDHAASTSKAP